MSLASPHPRGPNSIPWGVSLAAVSVLLIGAGTIIWVNRDESDSQSSQPVPASGIPDVAFVQRRIPLPPDIHADTLHSVTFGMERGNRIVKICVVEGGDELVVDAKSGRLLETRPSRTSFPPPGKFAAPFAPMM